jgi:hypothetical protein
VRASPNVRENLSAVRTSNPDMNTARALFALCALALAALVGLLSAPPVVVTVDPPPVAVAEPSEPAPAEAEDAPPFPEPAPASTPSVVAGPARDRRSDAELTEAALSVLPDDALATRVDVALGGLRRGELGAGLLACLGRAGAEPIQEVRSRTGTDFLTAVERATVTDPLAIVAGRFDGTRWAGLELGAEERRGSRGRLFAHNGTASETLAVYDDRLMIVARDRETAVAALERLERGDAPTPAARAGRSRGEIQGVLPAAGLIGEVPIGDVLRDGLRETLAARGARLEYGLSVVDGGLQVSARLVGAAGIEGIEALADGLEAGLAAAKSSPSAPSPHDPVGYAVAQVVSRARLSREGGGLTLDLDVPADLVRSFLAQCADPGGEATDEPDDGAPLAGYDDEAAGDPEVERTLD